MKKLHFVCTLLIMFIFTFFSCKNESAESKKQQDPVLLELGGSAYEDLIRTPINPDGTIDTTNMPRISFIQQEINFGDVKKGEKRNHTFEFTNTGVRDLHILNTSTSCGCTVSEHTKEPVKPGGIGTVDVEFDSTLRKVGNIKKVVVVRSNTYPNVQELIILANITE